MDTSLKQWFAVQTYTGHEKKVKLNIEHRVRLDNLTDFVGEVVVPEKKRVEKKNGKNRDVMQNLMPGYVLIQMDPEDAVFTLVKSIPGVSAFLSEGDKPIPLAHSEVAHLIDTMDDKGEKPKAIVNFSVGDTVKVVDGPFANFMGRVEFVDEEKGRLKVSVQIFGRTTSVDLEVLQVEAQ